MFVVGRQVSGQKSLIYNAGSIINDRKLFNAGELNNLFGRATDDPVSGN